MKEKKEETDNLLNANVKGRISQKNNKKKRKLDVPEIVSYSFFYFLFSCSECFRKLSVSFKPILKQKQMK